jgi:hypothetical protein
MKSKSKEVTANLPAGSGKGWGVRSLNSAGNPDRKKSCCVMGYTRGAGIFVRMSVENKLSHKVFEKDGHEK